MILNVLLLVKKKNTRPFINTSTDEIYFIYIATLTYGSTALYITPAHHITVHHTTPHHTIAHHNVPKN